MSIQDILSQDEIDALLQGVDNDDINVEEDDADPSQPKEFDLINQNRIIRGNMPALEVINEKFARATRASLFSLLKQNVEVTANGIQMPKFGDYVHSLYVPTSLNFVKIRALAGTALFILDAKLVFCMLDLYFGGEGRRTKIEGREFTPTENQVIRLFINIAFKNLTSAWKNVRELDFQFLSSEVNPAFATMINPGEIVVNSSFTIEMEGGGGDFHFILPYTMIEPIRPLLDSGSQGDSDEDDGRWALTLEQHVLNTKVKIKSNLAEVPMTLKEVLNMEAGDIILVDPPKELILSAANLPIFKVLMGQSGGKAALQVVSAPLAGGFDKVEYSSRLSDE